jgi:DNA-binding NarL/FixJ family response regulator
MNDGTKMMTLFLAEGEKQVRAVLRLLLEHEPCFAIMGEARTAESVLAKICQNPPDVIFLDWNLPGLHPQRQITALRLCAPNTFILAVSVKP